MILFLVPIVCVAVGLALYAGLRATGAFGTMLGDPSPPSGGGWRSSTVTGPTSLRERVLGLSPGCLLAVVIAAGVWILGWLIVMAVGLHLLG